MAKIIPFPAERVRLRTHLATALDAPRAPAPTAFGAWLAVAQAWTDAWLHAGGCLIEARAREPRPRPLQRVQR